MTTETETEPIRWCLFFGDQLVISRSAQQSYHLPVGNSLQEVIDPQLTDGSFHTVNLPDGSVVRAVALHALPDSTDTRLTIGLRASYDYLPYDDYLAAGKSSQILYWDSHSRFCPCCGTATRQETPIMKKCPRCGQELYPPIATAIIVLIKREEEILLVHARNFRGNFHGLVAGFLEAGETLEQCVEREVKEETGLSIRNIRYYASQPWPYPSGLMVGFTADYAGGSIKLQDEELSEGAFYRRDNLPEIPRKLSIARRLIDAWLAGEV